MLVQAVVVASVLCVGEFVCAPIYVELSHRSLAMVPWAFSACLLAVAFTYTVGFALLWAVESLAGKIRAKFLPLAYAAGGLLGFAGWCLYVFTSLLNSILEPLGLPMLTSGQQVAIGINGAALGVAAFFLAAVLAKSLSGRKATVLVMGVFTLIFAGLGAFFLVSMYSQLY